MSRAIRPLLTVAQVARRLGVTPHSLATRRYLGNGPPYIVVGPKLLRYDADALEAWLQARTRTETPRSVKKAKAASAKAPAPLARPDPTVGAPASTPAPTNDADKKKAPAVAPRQGLLSTSTTTPSNLMPSSVAIATLPR